MPDEPEVHGLAALMEIQASRLRARRGPDGSPILLADQNRSTLGSAAHRPGLDALARAEALRHPLGPYTLQAAIAACHARARTAEDTDWVQIVALYDALAALNPSPVVELNSRCRRLDGLRTCKKRWCSSTRSWPMEGFRRTTCCPRFGPTCWRAWAERRKREQSSFDAATLTSNEQERNLLRTRAAESRRLRSHHSELEEILAFGRSPALLFATSTLQEGRETCKCSNSEISDSCGSVRRSPALATNSHSSLCRG